MKKEDWHQIIRGLSLLTQVGILMVISIGIGFLLGYCLDLLTGRDLLFKIIGLLVGTASGFYSNYKLISSMIEEDDSDNDNSDKHE